MATASVGFFALTFLQNPEPALKLLGIGIVTFLLLLPLGLVLFDKAQSVRQPADAETLLREDARQPVLYLRAFRNAGADTVQTLNFGKSTSRTDEERLAVVMKQVGPFVAISETSGGKTDFGAARLSVGHDEWQATVLRLMFDAQLIVIRIDPLTEKWGRFQKDTVQYQLIKEGGLRLQEVPEPNDFLPRDIPPSVWWEIEQAIKTKPQRTLLYLPFKGTNIEREAIYEDIARLLQKFVEARLPDKIRGAEFIGFRPDGTAYLLHNKGIRMFGIVNSYGKILEPCFKNIGVYPRRISVDYFRIVEVILTLTTWALIAATFASIFLKASALIFSKFYPHYELLNEINKGFVLTLAFPPFGMPAITFWMYVSASLLFIIGLIKIFGEVPQQHGVDKIMPFGRLFFAIPLAVFGSQHFTITSGIATRVPGWIPAPTFWVYLVGLAFLCAALSITVLVKARLAAALVGLTFLIFVLVIDMPAVVANPGDRFDWALALRQLAFSGGAFAFAMSPWSSTSGQSWREQSSAFLAAIPRFFVGIPTVFYGVEHLLHPEYVPGIPLNKVTPEWIPGRMFLSYLVGVILILAGVCLLVNKKTRIGATILGLTILLTVLWIYLPMLFAAPTDMPPLYFFFDTLLFCGAILLLANVMDKETALARA